MKRHKAPGLSGLVPVAEMIQTAGILELSGYWTCGIVKEGCIPSVVLPIYKIQGDPMECGSYREIKLLEYAMKVVERI